MMSRNMELVIQKIHMARMNLLSFPNLIETLWQSKGHKKCLVPDNSNSAITQQNILVVRLKIMIF